MTREEAIYWIENLTGYWDGKYREARDMAISALRQQEHFREVTKKVEPMTLDDAIAHLDDTLSDTGRKWSCKECGFCEVKAEKETLNEKGCRH